MQRGGDAHNSGNLRLALAEYQKAVEISPDYPLAHLNTGITLEGTGALQEAIKSYQQALAALPTIRSFGRGLLETCHPPTHAYTRRHTRSRKCTHARTQAHARPRARTDTIATAGDLSEPGLPGRIPEARVDLPQNRWHTTCHVAYSMPCEPIATSRVACMHALNRDVRSLQPLSCIGELGGGSTPLSHRPAHCTQHEDALTDGAHEQLAGSEYRLLVAARACTAVRQA